MHHSHCLDGVRALGCFSRQHDAVCSVQDGIGDVADLGAGWSWIVCHRFEHLGCADARFTNEVALCNHHFLGKEDLRRWNLNTEVTTSHHDTVSLAEDLVEIIYTLLVLNLGHNSDLFALFSQAFANFNDITGTANERSKDDVDAIFHSKQEIGFVFFRECRQVDVCAWKVNSLAGAEVAIVETLGDHVLVVNFLYFKGENTIIDVDDLALVNDLWEVLVVYVEVLNGARFLVLVVGSDVEDGTSCDWDLTMS